MKLAEEVKKILQTEINKAEDYKKVSIWSDLKNRVEGLVKYGKKHPTKEYIIYIPEAGRGVLVGTKSFWFGHFNSDSKDFHFEAYRLYKTSTSPYVSILEKLANKLDIKPNGGY